ncbi:MAG: hypothetical protein JXR70_16550 [Spirochaetales bacterium]|nr:hypothetical protein [Spirochaetales bacterium]
MKLTEQSIEQEAIRIYQESLNKHYIPEDFRSEIYYGFIKKMKAYSMKNPEKSEVSDHYTARVVTNLVRDLRRKEIRNNLHEEDIESCGCFYVEDLCGLYEDKGSKELEDLLIFIKLVTSRRCNYVEYARSFLLYYAYYLPLSYIHRVYDLLALDDSRLDDLVKELRDSAVSYKSRRIDNRKKLLGFYYHRIISCQVKIASAENIDEKEYYQKKEAEYIERRTSLLAKSGDEEILPRCRDVAMLISSTSQNVNYGLRVFLRDFKKYLHLPKGAYFQFVKKVA